MRSAGALRRSRDAARRPRGRTHATPHLAGNAGTRGTAGEEKPKLWGRLQQLPQRRADTGPKVLKGIECKKGRRFLQEHRDLPDRVLGGGAFRRAGLLGWQSGTTLASLRSDRST